MKQRGSGQVRKTGAWVLRYSLVAVWTLLLFVWLEQVAPDTIYAQDIIPIGQIQGGGSESAYQEQPVRFRAIVTGVLEDQNASGTRFYTVFVQDVPGSEDGNPQTSDGLAIFAGARRPSLAIGDIATIGGIVTEFYGLTELDNNGLHFSVESRNNPLPEPVALDPPADNQQAAEYLERFEAMLVSIPGASVVGPSHIGCGFSVVRGQDDVVRISASNERDPVGQVVGVLHPTDVECDDMPAVAFGDRINGLFGPLTYHFDRFKIVYQDQAQLQISRAEMADAVGPMTTSDEQLVIASFNVNNYFDVYDDTGDEAELKPSAAEVALKQFKMAATIAEVLNCPDIIGLQEVENKALLNELSRQLAESCGFLYQVSHQDAPDQRGEDVALFSNPERVSVESVWLRQSCAKLDTGVQDPTINCGDGLQPLFSRPPLQVEVTAGGETFEILVNHLKSKRGGTDETAALRLAQAEYIRQLAEEIQNKGDGRHAVVIGDFNDYDESAAMLALQDGGWLVDALGLVSEPNRYSYIFDGVSQLIDWILVSPSLAGEIVSAGIAHVNADYPYQLDQSAAPEIMAYRSSDHDIPFVIIDLGMASNAEQGQTNTPPPSTPAPTAQSTLEGADWRNPTSTLEPSATFTITQAPAMYPSDAPVTASEVIPVSTPGAEPEEAGLEAAELGSNLVLGVAILFMLVTAGLLIAILLSNRKRSG